HCDFLKIDCEGAEYDIMFHATADTLRRIRHISMEYHDGVTSHSHGELRAFLEKHGFRVQVHGNAAHRNLGYLYATHAGRGRRVNAKCGKSITLSWTSLLLSRSPTNGKRWRSSTARSRQYSPKRSVASRSSSSMMAVLMGHGRSSAACTRPTKTCGESVSAATSVRPLPWQPVLRMHVGRLS